MSQSSCFRYSETNGEVRTELNDKMAFLMSLFCAPHRLMHTTLFGMLELDKNHFVSLLFSRSLSSFRRHESNGKSMPVVYLSVVSTINASVEFDTTTVRCVV